MMLRFQKPLFSVRGRRADVMRAGWIVVPLTLYLIFVRIAGGDDVLRGHQGATRSSSAGERHRIIEWPLGSLRLATQIGRDSKRRRIAREEQPDVGDVPRPGIMVPRGVARISSQCASEIRLLGQRH